MPQFQPNDHSVALEYVERWFWSLDSLVEATGLEPDRVTDLMDHGCAPGPIYRLSATGQWWSALAAYLRGNPGETAASDRVWYSPGSLRWLRRAKVLMDGGASAKQAAEAHREDFTAHFVALVGTIAGAERAYPSCFGKSRLLLVAEAQELGRSEWDAWAQGAYGVCLRDFSAYSCIQKSALAAMLKDHFDEANPTTFSPIEVVDMSADLAALVTPFSPWERAPGTPGQAIDPALRTLGLGTDFPAPYALPARTIERPSLAHDATGVMPAAKSPHEAV